MKCSLPALFPADKGYIVEEGSPEEIFSRPREERTQIFLKRLLHTDI